jgi:hypothetical protein
MPGSRDALRSGTRNKAAWCLVGVGRLVGGMVGVLDCGADASAVGGDDLVSVGAYSRVFASWSWSAPRAVGRPVAERRPPTLRAALVYGLSALTILSRFFLDRSISYLTDWVADGRDRRR